MRCDGCRYWRQAADGMTRRYIDRGWGKCLLLTDGNESFIAERISIGAYGGADVETAPDFFCAEYAE